MCLGKHYRSSVTDSLPCSSRECLPFSQLSLHLSNSCLLICRKATKIKDIQHFTSIDLSCPVNLEYYLLFSTRLKELMCLYSYLQPETNGKGRQLMLNSEVQHFSKYHSSCLWTFTLNYTY